MLLCVSLVWPTKFANTLSFCAKQFWCLKILILGKLGLKLFFWKTLHHILMHFVHQFQCFEVFLKCVFAIFKNCVFSKNLWASVLFDWSNLFFRLIKSVLKFLRKPLFASIDPICFSINRNCFKFFKRSLCLYRSIETDFRSIENRESGFFKIRVWLVQTYFSERFSNFSLSPNWTRLSHKFFVVFLQIFCKVFLSISR